MTIEETIEAILTTAKLKYVQERAMRMRFGLGEEAKRLDERYAILRADPQLSHLSPATLTKDWVRRQESTASQKMRSAMLKLKINTNDFHAQCTEEPYTSLCDMLLGSPNV